MRKCLILVFFTYCTACQRLPETALAPPGSTGVDRTPAVGEVYTIDAANSEVRVLVFRAGPLANLGHNHVVTAREVTGRVVIAPRFEDSWFELLIPVAELEVDNPSARAAAGDGFSAVPGAADIAATRDNMLGPDLLDADRHPTVEVSGRFAASVERQVVLSILVRGRVAVRTVPVALSVADDSLSVDAAFEMSHEELGLRPFSVMMGAIRVDDTIRFRVRLAARRAAEAAS